MSDANVAQMWKSVFRARAILNDASLGVRLGPDDLLRTIKDLLGVVDRLRCSYDTQYSHLRLAQHLLREMTGAAPVPNAGEGEEWHAISHDLLLRVEQFLLHTAPHDNGL